MAARALQVCMLAQQALEAVAGKLPRQPAFRMLLDTLRKEQQDGTGEAPIVLLTPRTSTDRLWAQRAFTPSDEVLGTQPPHDCRRRS